MSAIVFHAGGDLSASGMKRQTSHPHLNKFREAKREIGVIFTDMACYVSECHKFVEELTGDKTFSLLIEAVSYEEVSSYLNKVRYIQGVISRNHMKCAFFGRTSNGKSTVINAMLGSRLLPSCVGHTTSCFLEVQGTDKDTGYLLTPNDINGDTSDACIQPRPIESVSQLGHALSGFKLSTETLLKIYWPNIQCRLLREDVVLLDSPGINVDPGIDQWIDLHCLDADVFILVANAESTLMQAEKDFFHKVSQKLSKPNIFILNNRWDASANEMEYVNEVREQHLQRCVSFLVDELKVASPSEAEERVFFVSARETLTIRTKPNFNNLENHSLSSIVSNGITPSPTLLYMAEGWQSRLDEFNKFEAIFEKILSESATRTKFASHLEQGKEIVNRLKAIMETAYETSIEEKDAGVRCRHLTQARIEDIHSRLAKTTLSIDEMLHASLARVEAQVASALNSEIRHLHELVDSYARPFHPDPALLHVYKSELNTHVERELGRKLTEACSKDILNEVARSEQVMMSKYATLVTDEVCKNLIFQSLDPSAFSPEFHVDCRNLCADFREDIQFHFSLNLNNLFRRLSSSSRRPPSHYAWSNPNRMIDGSPAMLIHSIGMFPHLFSRTAVGILVVFGITTKTVGFRLLTGLAGIYGALYLYERLSWTNKAKEAAFRRQYVDFASNKLRLIVDLTSNNARHQAKRELHLAHQKVSNEVKKFSELLTKEVDQLDNDIERLCSIITIAKGLKNRASYLLTSLNKFYDVFIVGNWIESN